MCLVCLKVGGCIFDKAVVLQIFFGNGWDLMGIRYGNGRVRVASVFLLNKNQAQIRTPVSRIECLHMNIQRMTYTHTYVHIFIHNHALIRIVFVCECV